MPQDHPVYPHLFSSFELAGRRLRNRVVHLSMSTRMAANYKVTDRLMNYAASRAKGGAAMMVTESLCCLPSQVAPYKVRVWHDDDLDDLKRWAEAVESEDCRFLGQLQDQGRGSHMRGRAKLAIGVSALPDDLSWTVPRTLSTDEIKEMNETMAACAARLKRAGFSGVELSAGHGHLFHQFLSPWSNVREDAYGGDLENRTRQLRELIDAIRSECGSDFILGVRLPGYDGVEGSIDEAEGTRIAGRITQMGALDYINFVQGAHSPSLDIHLPEMHGPRAPYLGLFKRMASVTGDVPLMACGLITDPNEAERIVASGAAALVGLGRPLITDPAWPKKAQEGREAQIRYCVSCNTCWGQITAPAELACDNNPRVGERQEADWRPQKAAAPKKVVIVGAGIAGMEAAWIAAARGHDVTVFGSGAEAGGKTRLHAKLPGGENLSSIYDYQILEASHAGVHLMPGRQVNAQDVFAEQPDEVILATGATMTWPRWLPSEYQGSILSLRDLMPLLLKHPIKQPGTAVVFDQDHTTGTYDAAEFLADKFDRVVIITPREQLARDEALVVRQGIYRRLYERRVEVVLLSEPLGNSAFEDGVVQYRNLLNGDEGEISEVALFTFSTPRQPNIELLAPLRQVGIEPCLIGDCLAPRSVLAATHEGHAVGNEL